MTSAEVQHLIGTEQYVQVHATTRGPVMIRVKVQDHKSEWGRDRWLLYPCEGNGSWWSEGPLRSTDLIED